MRELAGDLPPLSGDPDELMQVFTNILVNAELALVDSGGEKRIIVWTRGIGGTQLLAEIGNTGPGIPEAVRDRIFAPFFTTKPQGVGTGIGLSVCNGIVQAHGGSIDVVSDTGGTTFRLLLPADKTLARPEAVEPVAKEGASSGHRILVVDDEPDVAELIAEVLEDDGHDIEIADGGLAALERDGYDLVNSDLRMPDLDDRTLWEQAEARWPGVYRLFLFLTGDTLSPLSHEFLVEGERSYLEKPITPADLRSAVAEALAGLAADS